MARASQKQKNQKESKTKIKTGSVRRIRRSVMKRGAYRQEAMDKSNPMPFLRELRSGAFTRAEQYEDS